MEYFLALADKGISLAKSLKLRKSAEYMIGVLFGMFVIIGSRLVHNEVASEVVEWGGVVFLIGVLGVWLRYLGIESRTSDPAISRPSIENRAPANRQVSHKGRRSSKSPANKGGK